MPPDVLENLTEWSMKGGGAPAPALSRLSANGLRELEAARIRRLPPFERVVALERFEVDFREASRFVFQGLDYPFSEGEIESYKVEFLRSVVDPMNDRKGADSMREDVCRFRGALRIAQMIEESENGIIADVLRRMAALDTFIEERAKQRPSVDKARHDQLEAQYQQALQEVRHLKREIAAEATKTASLTMEADHWKNIAEKQAARIRAFESERTRYEEARKRELEAEIEARHVRIKKLSTDSHEKKVRAVVGLIGTTFAGVTAWKDAVAQRAGLAGATNIDSWLRHAGVSADDYEALRAEVEALCTAALSRYDRNNEKQEKTT